MSSVKLYEGDCLVESDKIASGSVDLILTDLPYGNMYGIAEGDTSWGRTNTEWDTAIDPAEVFAVTNRILRKNGKIVLTSQEPYTSRLINETIPNIPFNYRMIWEKDIYGNALFAKKAPLIFYEDILVFSKTHDTDGIHPLRVYFSEVFEFIGLTKSAIISEIGGRADHTFRTNSTQFDLCTKETYTALISSYNIDEMSGFMAYEVLHDIDRKTKEDAFPSVFNLWEGGKYKSNILRYKKDYDGHHPTQKPVLLLEDLIKSYSNEGDLVVDLTMGSGSTGVAAANCGRDFVGIEMNNEYFDIAKRRIDESLT